MISEALFKILSQDSTDVTASSVLTAVNNRNDTSLIEAELPLYTYKSLKTLLGETSVATDDAGNPVWAVNKIKSGIALQKFQAIQQPEALPVIFIGSNNLIKAPKSNIKNLWQADISFSIYTNPRDSASSQATNIAQRIHSLFNIYTSNSFLEVPKIFEPSGVLPVDKLRMHFVGHEEDNWDKVKSVYKAEFIVIV